ncbi:unnamed protein product [Polarella glacialis]|uniref:Ion transport domain-containing protein n=1 Tax=Polarella glacialis TaxID=89957 RepID=A0A813FFN0_POLGL|nr:unnamed protein product [Polarella glacialis]
MSRAMSDKFQKLLGDLTVQYMTDVQELRDENLKLKSENDCLKDGAALEGHTPVPAKRANGDFKFRHMDSFSTRGQLTHCSRLANFLRSDTYELFVGFIILMNVCVMAAVLQVQGTELGYSLGYPGYSEPSGGSQEASKVCAVLDLLCLSLFTVDIILRAAVLRTLFFKAPLNCVDLLVVLSALIEVLGHGFMDPFFIRMLRLVKFGRAFRAMQISKVSHSLKILGKCITASVGMLFWSLCLLCVIQCIGGMMLSILVRPFMEDPEIDPAVRRVVFRYYGTFSGSMLTIFEVLFANSSIPARILVDNVSEWFSLWFIIYRCL